MKILEILSNPQVQLEIKLRSFLEQDSDSQSFGYRVSRTQVSHTPVIKAGSPVNSPAFSGTSLRTGRVLLICEAPPNPLQQAHGAWSWAADLLPASSSAFCLL